MSLLSRAAAIFPPPRYMQMPSVGVDISDSSLKYVFFEPSTHENQRFELVHSGSIDITEGAVERGVVNDVDALAKALRSVKESTGIEHVRISLPEERAYLFETEIPGDTPFKEIRGQLEFKLEENVPLSPRDAYFDYEVLPLPKEEHVRVVSVTAYARETVDAYYTACQKAGVTPLSFEVEAQAIARAAIQEGDVGTYMIVDFGKTRTGVGIVNRGLLLYTSTIDIGGNHLSTALRKQLGEMEEDDLTDIKNTEGLTKGAEDTPVYEALLETVTGIKDELAARINYWNDRHADKADRFIEEIILCGGSSNLKGLPEYLRTALDIDASRANVWTNTFSLEEYVPEIDRLHSYGYATAVGLGLASYKYSL